MKDNLSEIGYKQVHALIERVQLQFRDMNETMRINRGKMIDAL
ncbi:hypothetical protein [Breoghania sp.]|nr:hypothetical protein [Breoghania sp.]MDJ0932517.1 hypothetical protein [Breoghania sp.]